MLMTNQTEDDNKTVLNVQKEGLSTKYMEDP
jgi:hypothetical protein